MAAGFGESSSLQHHPKNLDFRGEIEVTIKMQVTP
jgi:hypothetical protein